MDKDTSKAAFTSAKKRVLITRIVCIAVIALCVAVMVTIINPPGKAECTITLLSGFGVNGKDIYDGVRVEFSREVESAKVTVEFISPSGRVADTQEFSFGRGKTFTETLDKDYYGDEVNSARAASVDYKLGADGDTVMYVCIFGAAFIVCSLLIMIRTRCKVFDIKGHNVEIYSGNVRRYIRVDGRIKAHRSGASLTKTQLRADVGDSIIVADIGVFSGINVSEEKSGGGECVKNEGQAYLEEGDAVRGKKKIKEAIRVRVIYALTVLAAAAMTAGGIAIWVTVDVTWGICLLLPAACACMMGFMCTYKVYYLDGYTVVLYSGLYRRYIRINGEIKASCGRTRYNRDIILHAQAGSFAPEASFAGLRHMDLKIINYDA